MRVGVILGGQKGRLELGVKVGVKVDSKELLKDTYGAQGTAPPTARIKRGAYIYIYLIRSGSRKARKSRTSSSRKARKRGY